MLLHYKVEATAPALTDLRLCQKAAYTAALPTVRRLCQTKAALPDLGTKDPAHSKGGVANRRQLCQHLAAALTRRPSWSYAFIRGCKRPSRVRGLGLRGWRQRPGLPISWTCDAAAFRCSCALLYLLIILIYKCLKKFAGLPPPPLFPSWYGALQLLCQHTVL